MGSFDLRLALDQIITQIMENSNSHAPVPATEEIMDKLPRSILEEGCKYRSIRIQLLCSQSFSSTA